MDLKSQFFIYEYTQIFSFSSSHSVFFNCHLSILIPKILTLMKRKTQLISSIHNHFLSNSKSLVHSALYFYTRWSRQCQTVLVSIFRMFYPSFKSWGHPPWKVEYRWCLIQIRQYLYIETRCLPNSSQFYETVLTVMCRLEDVHDFRPPYIIEYPLYIKQNDRVVFKRPFDIIYFFNNCLLCPFTFKEFIFIFMIEVFFQNYF